MFLRIVLVLVAAKYTLGLVVQPEWKIYYDIKSNKTIEALDNNNPRLKIYRQRQLKIGFGPIPCACEGLGCGCCAGMNIPTIGINRRACMNFTYVPSEFGINMAMIMNDESVVNRTFSAKNPPPVCMPAPLPPVVPRVDFCMRFFNVHTQDYNIFSCIDFETRIERAPILVLHFDCLRMGQDGIAHYKPEDLEPPAPEEGASSEGQDDEQIEVYDEVAEDSLNVTTVSTPAS